MTTAQNTSVDTNSDSTPAASNGRSRAYILLALLPCLGSLYCSTADQNLPPLTITRPPQTLQFATYMYHHGDEPVKSGATLHTEFQFRNAGSTTVNIGKVTRSCGCMTPEWTKSLAPGEVGSLDVPLDMTRQTPGFHEYVLTVHYTDPEPHETTLTIKANFPEKMVIVQPRSLYLSQRSDKPVDFQVDVSDYRDTPLRVKNVTATADFVKTTIKRKTMSDIVQVAHSVNGNDSADEPLSGTKAEIAGTVAGNIPPGQHHVLVHATTDDAEYPVVTVPMVIHGPMYPPGKEAVMTPSHVRLMASDTPGTKVEDRVVLLAPPEWEISHAMAWPEELEVTYEPVAGLIEGKQATRVSIKLAKIPELKTPHGNVQLYANDGKDLITVNVSLVWPDTTAQ